MRGVVWKAPYQVSVEEVGDPRIEALGDALLRLTTAGICGSDFAHV
jgi:glutathione-independent formaldehyde dehydrogenase